MTKLLIDLAIAVGVVIYLNIGWLYIYFLDNPKKTGIFKNFLIGPWWLVTEKEREAEIYSKENKFADIYVPYAIAWPIALAILFIVWLIQIMIWLYKIGTWVLRMTFGGIAKKIVGEE